MSASGPSTALPRATSIPGVRPVLHLVGMVLVATAVMMLFPLLVDLYYGC
jgi:hypothetical protein